MAKWFMAKDVTRASINEEWEDSFIEAFCKSCKEHMVQIDHKIDWDKVKSLKKPGSTPGGVATKYLESLKD